MASQSILTSTKKLVGISEDYTVFDLDITLHINSVFSTLQQLGVGPSLGFSIEDETTTWDQFIGLSSVINNVKSYMYLRVRLLFDPPATSFALDAMSTQIKELEWRLNVAVDKSGASTVPLPEDYEGTLWSLTGRTDFPPAAQIGDLGVDLSTGNIYRKN